MTLQCAHHLRQNLALDDHGFALAMMLRSQITDLEGKLRTARPKRHKLRLTLSSVGWVRRRTDCCKQCAHSANLTQPTPTKAQP